GLGLARITVGQRLDPLDVTAGKILQPRLLDDDVVYRHSDLGPVPGLADRRSVDRRVHVSVAQHHKGTVATQLQCHMLEVLATAGDTADIAAHRGGTGEGDEGGDRVLDKGITDFRTGAHHHTEYT